MTAEPADWEKITPRHLLPAVEHIRTTFETGHWKCSTITSKLGHAALHSPVDGSGVSLPLPGRVRGLSADDRSYG